MAIPRLHRWSSKLTISATQCSKLQVKLSKPDNIRFLQEDRSEVLPGDIIDWPIHVIEGLPTQDNGNDCGIFVMKYLEASLGRDQVDWKRHSSWTKEMSRIRAEIVTALLQTFQASLLISNACLPTGGRLDWKNELLQELERPQGSPKP
ncbi:putative ubiquitin-like-specific protease 1B [Platanthera guangdongensis]|uniref:Ubiquitin-like-specific protease 1B n=1 Tax=Platanthera guangdongensis TaxID=2320717 RepID=A0ABR2N0G6_9ASPA